MYTDRIGSDRIGSDRTLVGSDKNYRLSENPTIRSEVSKSRLNNIHIADTLLTDKIVGESYELHIVEPQSNCNKTFFQ